jgi:acyl carrier protein phosphodiesterase
MNFLGHLYFSNNNIELMYANLYGDHIKGRNLGHLPNVVQKGIELHRSIDNYIDHHPKVIELMHQLYPELPKVTGIAIDLFFDYLLAKNWDNYHSHPFEIFLHEFYSYEPIYWNDYSNEYKEFIVKMRTFKWMNYYKEFEGLKKSCEGVSARLSFPNELVNAPNVFLKHEKIITSCFKEYMKEAIHFFDQKENNN